MSHETEADRRYGELLRRLMDTLDDAGRAMLVELDDLVGERLCEHQAWAVQRLFLTWRLAADGMIDEALLPDGPREMIDYRRVAELR